MEITVRMAKDKKSAIILIGNLYYAREINGYEELKEFINSFPNYVVKHCDNPNIPTHIDKNGFVNRYGILISKEEIDFCGKEYIDFPKGKYRKEDEINFEELKKIMNKGGN